MPDFAEFLEYLSQGASIEDAAALVGVLPPELDAWLDQVPDARRQVARAEAKFRLTMTAVVVECAQVRRSVQAARHFLARPARSNQLTLNFANTPAKVELDLPDNGRGPCEPV